MLLITIFVAAVSFVPGAFACGGPSDCNDLRGGTLVCGASEVCECDLNVCISSAEGGGCGLCVPAPTTTSPPPADKCSKSDIIDFIIWFFYQGKKDYELQHLVSALMDDNNDDRHGLRALEASAEDMNKVQVQDLKAKLTQLVNKKLDD